MIPHGTRNSAKTEFYRIPVKSKPIVLHVLDLDVLDDLLEDLDVLGSDQVDHHAALLLAYLDGVAGHVLVKVAVHIFFLRGPLPSGRGESAPKSRRPAA